ncbi:MAG TPA: hypothetical protein VJL81_10340 [Solirubrobacterales bacterium]|nr:hypothetical protein [Solirubrobacterales bacterium]
MRNARPISRRLALLGAAVVAATALLGAIGAAAASTFATHAQRPAYDASALELRGHGGYTTARKHSELRVTVCLQKRLGGRAFSVRCETGVAAGRRVSAEVSVPGCVKGSWRTTSTGAALNAKGEWVHQASATSAPYHC